MKLLWISRYVGNLNGYRPEGEILIDLKKAGVDVTFMGHADQSYLDRIEQHGITVVPYQTPDSKLSLTAIKQIRAELKRGQYDLVHAFQGKTISAMLIAAIGIKVKTVAYRGQTGNIFRHDPSSYLTMLSPRLDAITCVAKAIEDDLRLRVWNQNKPNITTIYKGHNVEWYQRTPKDRAEMGIPEDAFVLGFSANVRPRKGIHVLIEAANYLPKDANIHILLMGHGTDGEEIRKLCDETHLGAQLHTLGFRRDIIELTSMCDATTLPTTKREGFSRSIVESQSMEIPAVVSDTGGNAEIVADGETGYVVPPSDAKALAEAIEKLYSDRELCRQFGKNARQRIATHFNHDLTVERYMAFYRELLA